MRWIGLTGGIGSGKSSVAKLLRSKGFAVLDADEVARRAVEPGTPAFNRVIQTFGQKFLSPDGSLDRKSLGNFVFQNKTRLEELEQILHPAIRQEIKEQATLLEQQGHSLIFYDVPLLYEKNMESQFETVIVVDAPLEIRIERVMKRDNLRRELIEQRIAQQKPLEEKVKQAHFVIDNSKDEKWLEQKLNEVLKVITMPKSSQS